MAYSINIETFGELIEDFLVNTFNNIEVAGSVSAREEGNINYIQIDLPVIEDWDQDAKSLINKIRNNLAALFKEKPLSLYYTVKFKNLTIDIRTANSDNNRSETIQLFYTQQKIGQPIKEDNFILAWAKKHWEICTVVIVTIPLAVISFIFLNNNPGKQANFENGISQVNIFAGIMGAFALSYVASKIIAVKQEKLSRVPAIRDLCYKLTCFRRICYHLRTDNQFWDDSESYRYAKSVSDQISYEDAQFPDYDNEAKYAHYRSLIVNERHDTRIILFYLQLAMFADEEFDNDPNLSWRTYPPFIIYSHDQISRYTTFLDYNEFWNCIDNNKIRFNYQHNRFHIDPIEDAATRYNSIGKKEKFSEELLLGIASDVQNKVILDLYHLTKLNEAKLPYLIVYLLVITSAMMTFSVVYPLLVNIFTDNFILKNLNGFMILGLILDMVVRLPKLLSKENTLLRPDDYR
ncbi:hypothetical protein [Chitinophaga sp. CF418]|uniref:hypothetical protein n=1 Tax=Chitinophaga sp. CF418 TaxID=1855287 RepID=UPI00091C38AA|nr:hypothetical protein [Chitinophaga sp. CF418]SHN45556.1 hypothetical protein SAMN05216311_120106 [Chitinophaga sp. CF418]